MVIIITYVSMGCKRINSGDFFPEPIGEFENFLFGVGRHNAGVQVKKHAYPPFRNPLLALFGCS